MGGGRDDGGKGAVLVRALVAGAITRGMAGRAGRAGRRAGRWLHALSGDMHVRNGGLWIGERALFLTPLLKMVVNLLTCQSVSAAMQTEVTAFLHSLEGVH